MKKILLLLIIAISAVCQAQNYNIETSTPCNECCPYKTVVTIYADEIHNLHNISIPAIVPGLQGNGQLAKGVRFASAPMMQVYSDGGAGFTFQSGAYIRVQNSGGVLSTLCEWSDPCVTLNGSYVADNWRSYEVVHSSIDDATVFLVATEPITSGGTNAKIVFTFFYYLENY